ncbi:hypothetical protein HID58_054619 [Brassica napus]|uniref:BnaC03g47350D protein n=2 Tax=Brassica napus TaxID=3708 RepID=A0A078F482_BRANA|nr:hypothetical protein HID58_054619 [Brassica napus]CAF1706435.1 unnamed protein product [Brassica napus]CDY07887.1 BnaC03g47350D [Brassica napus]
MRFESHKLFFVLVCVSLYLLVFFFYFSFSRQVASALSHAGLESSNLIVGIDVTKSNDWTDFRLVSLVITSVSNDNHCINSPGGKVDSWSSLRETDQEAGQQLMCKSMEFNNDASDKKLIIDLGFWLPQSIKSVVHGEMSSGLINGRPTYIPYNRITEKQNSVAITDRMWTRLMSSTNQSSFLDPKDITEEKNEVPEKPHILTVKTVTDFSIFFELLKRSLSNGTKTLFIDLPNQNIYCMLFP